MSESLTRTKAGMGCVVREPIGQIARVEDQKLGGMRRGGVDYRMREVPRHLCREPRVAEVQSDEKLVTYCGSRTWKTRKLDKKFYPRSEKDGNDSTKVARSESTTDEAQ